MKGTKNGVKKNNNTPPSDDQVRVHLVGRGFFFTSEKHVIPL